MKMKCFTCTFILNFLTVSISFNLYVSPISTLEVSTFYGEENEHKLLNGGLFRRLRRNKENESGNSFTLAPCKLELLQCKEDEICITGFCHCKEGLERKKNGSCEKLSPKGKGCENGLLMCSENEICKPFNNRRKDGICECREGFKRNEDGNCFKVLPFPHNINNNFTASSSFPPGTVPLLSTDQNNANASSLTTSIPIQDSTDNIFTSVPVESVSRPYNKIIVNINNKTITLPLGVQQYKEWTTLSAYAIGDSESKYKFTWTLVDKPESKEDGAIKDMNTPTVSLSNLVAGTYIFKVMVNGTNAYGEATANITVLPAQHVNKPPVAVIVPSSQIIKLPNSVVIIDGSTSTDDTKIVSYQWELIMGPLGYKLAESGGATLQMTDLLPGNYTIMLKVKDEEGLEGNVTTSVVIVKETDYPPTANAGGDKIIYMPQTEITLNGNTSTDDHGIDEWEWTKGPEDSGNAVDMRDTRTPYLKLGNLEEGHYHFILKVVDTAKQTGNSSAHVYVHSSSDNLLLANAGDLATLIIPNTTAILDGSKSTGISSQTRYQWTQISGPNVALLSSIDKVSVNASNLTRGKYVFQLTIWNGEDKGKNSSSNVTINVIQEKNAAPVAHAGGDFSVILPVSVVIVNGSSSTDDVGITKWLWQRDSTSLAAGNVVQKSDHSPVLLFTNVVPGRYIWNLTVWDDQGSSSTDTVSIIVKDGPNHGDEVEVVLGVGIENLSVSQLNNFLQKLQLLLHSTTDVTFVVHSIQGRPLSGRVSLIFVGYQDDRIINGPMLAYQLKLKTITNSRTKILDLPIISVDTIVCQNNCSGHGECIQATRECRCHSWWMESSFRRKFGDGTPNCDWSVVYVFVGAIGSALLIGIIIWIIISLIVKNLNKLKQRKSKNPRYSLLEGYEESAKVKSRVPGALLESGSETESESEILFDTRKSRKKNDKLKNGHIKLHRIRT